MLLEEFRPNHCINCDLYKNCLTPDMKPSGNIDANLFILGEFPFVKDDLMNKPLMGESGNLLKTLLEYHKIDLSDIRYYNAVNCRPKNGEVPSDLQINSCRIKVLNDIKKTKPKVIVAMGNSALKSLFGKAEPGIFGWRGLVIPFHDLNCWVLPIFNPEKVVKDGLPENENRWTKDTNYTDTLKVFRDDLSIIPDLLKTPLPVNKPYYIKKLLKFDEVIEFFRMAEKQKFFTFDFETLGLKPYTKEACILTCAFTFDGETAYAFPISYYEYTGFSEYWTKIEEEEIILKELANLLNNRNIKKQVHNLIFEKEWSHALLDIDLDNLEDSMLQHYILYNREKTNNLDFIAFAEFGVRWKVISQSIMENLTKLSLNDLLEYNGQDAIWEYRLFKIQEKQLEKEKVLNEQYKEIMETAKTIAKIQFDGAVTNESSRENLIKTFQNERIEIEKQLKDLDSVKSFIYQYKRPPGLRSPKDISTILFNIENLESSKKTKKGNNSVDKEVLTKYMERGSLFCEYLLKFREYAGGESKLLSSYTDCVFPDGKYHTNFYFVVTGRLNSNNINLQNLDKRKHPEIRQLICAPPGHVLLIYDKCLHPDTEYLTQRGWVKVLDLEGDDLVWQVNKDSLEGNFIKPKRIIKKDYDGNMYIYKSYRGELTVTEDHHMLWVGQLLHKTKKHPHNYRKESLAQEGVPNSACYSSCFSYSNKKSNYSEKEIWIATMLEADGHLLKNGKYQIQVSYPRKRQKIKELLGYNGKMFEVRSGQNYPVEMWTIDFKSELLDGKIFKLNKLGQNQAELFCRALIFWDGAYHRYNVTKNKRNYWGSTNLNNVEEVQRYFVTNGYECCIINKDRARYANGINNKPFYKVSIKEKGTIRFGSINEKLSNIKVEKSYYKGKVGCVTVDSGYILVRSKGQTFVTGNCQLEARILAAVSNDRNFIEIIKNGYDIHLAKAIEIFGKGAIEKASKKQVKLYRFIAKNSFVFASFYGSKARATANRLGVTEEFAQQLLDKLWSDFPDIKTWQEEQLKFYKKKGYVIIPPGRRRYAPLTTNQILNTPIQGASSSIVCKEMDILSKRGYWIFLNCHDELVFCVKRENIKYANEEITEVMTAKYFDFMRDVPLEIEGSIGEDWYNTIPIKEVLG